MHYFEYNIKDYRADAFQLTLIQHGAYRQLIDQYYLNEKPLTLDIDDLCYELLIRGDDEKKAIVFILEKFFDKTEDGYAHKRCDVVIKKYKAKSNQSRNAVNTRWAKEKGKDTDVIRESYDRNTNQEPLTNNKEQFIEFVKPLDVNLEVWNNYMTLRRAQNKPITDANIKALRREAANAGMNLNAVITVCVENSWISFRADWVDRKKVEENKAKEVWGK
jgi:uncharacterized protein YdaU (DUF1376 family)